MLASPSPAVAARSAPTVYANTTATAHPNPRGNAAGSALGAASGKVMMDTNRGCSGIADVVTARVGAVPDANMRTNERMFNVAGKQAERGTRGADAGSAYAGQGTMRRVDSRT